jgi:hypothetical protein
MIDEQVLDAPRSPFGKVAFGQDLDAPGNAFAQELWETGLLNSRI